MKNTQIEEITDLIAKLRRLLLALNNEEISAVVNVCIPTGEILDGGIDEFKINGFMMGKEDEITLLLIDTFSNFKKMVNKD
jgi:hypothetical protein